MYSSLTICQEIIECSHSGSSYCKQCFIVDHSDLNDSRQCKAQIKKSRNWKACSALACRSSLKHQLPAAARALELDVGKHLLHLQSCFAALLSHSQSAERGQLMCWGWEEGIFYPSLLISRRQVISVLSWSVACKILIFQRCPDALISFSMQH